MSLSASFAITGFYTKSNIFLSGPRPHDCFSAPLGRPFQCHDLPIIILFKQSRGSKRQAITLRQHGSTGTHDTFNGLCHHCVVCCIIMCLLTHLSQVVQVVAVVENRANFPNKPPSLAVFEHCPCRPSSNWNLHRQSPLHLN